MKYKKYDEVYFRHTYVKFLKKRGENLSLISSFSFFINNLKSFTFSFTFDQILSWAALNLFRSSKHTCPSVSEINLHRPIASDRSLRSHGSPITGNVRDWEKIQCSASRTLIPLLRGRIFYLQLNRK